MQTICYDIISLKRKKLTLKKCQYCNSDLQTHAVDHSADSRAFDEKTEQALVTTTAVACPHCGWWAVRELREDVALYSPAVEELIVMDASKTVSAKPAPRAPAVEKSGPPPWEKVVADTAYWAKPETIPSREAVLLFGTAQMLLPNIGSGSGAAAWEKLKSYAPVLYPILIIAFIALFF
ncbi:MAG: hypothetical protein COW18_08855 [Zetaproteobacteria bacterium CG12_big_fil_rev_8_21_14_0_65_54_13]|nr:MAG: hypothetical protein COW18_08855 [Zetaproteobacteria bacterium CG12_big_fil_rev_8_21_14_0_65_54_13]PIX53914.1 MAG: hypothetical protein COZ50_10805 [Zetaproteobacteria bacterium CG_4_10_14_3_um_filter_54_28]PJA30083.1 MAG: hypothetical protein CO188_04765 [Zetaproteobacteria bacterium CG_4_9_14_3_um_filter_54_145]